MKTVKRILLLLLTLFVLTSCTGNGFDTEIEGLINNAESSTAEVVILEIAPGHYEYSIVNKHGAVVFSDTAFRLIPSYEYVSTEVIELRIGIGTGYWRSIFYNTETDALSAWFENPASSDGNSVVYVDRLPTGELAIVVQRIFTEEVVGTFVRDISPVANYGSSIVSAALINEHALRVTYLSGNEFEEKTELICLEAYEGDS